MYIILILENCIPFPVVNDDPTTNEDVREAKSLELEQESALTDKNILEEIVELITT